MSRVPSHSHHSNPRNSHAANRRARLGGWSTTGWRLRARTAGSTRRSSRRRPSASTARRTTRWALGEITRATKVRAHASARQCPMPHVCIGTRRADAPHVRQSAPWSLAHALPAGWAKRHLTTAAEIERQVPALVPAVAAPAPPPQGLVVANPAATNPCAGCNQPVGSGASPPADRFGRAGEYLPANIYWQWPGAQEQCCATVEELMEVSLEQQETFEVVAAWFLAHCCEMCCNRWDVLQACLRQCLDAVTMPGDGLCAAAVEGGAGGEGGGWGQWAAGPVSGS